MYIAKSEEIALPAAVRLLPAVRCAKVITALLLPLEGGDRDMGSANPDEIQDDALHILELNKRRAIGTSDRLKNERL
jgi:hypothetical protein